MLVWAHEGMGDAARQILETAGHRVHIGDGLTVLDVICPFAQWTRLTPPLHNVSPMVVATPCTDSSHCDRAREIGLRVLSLRDCGDLSSITATVEFTIGAILALTRRIPSAVESVRRGEWDRMRFQGNDLAGKHATIVGNGRIGSAVSRILLTLGMGVRTYDIKVPASSLLDRIREADVVTVHASLNETSRGMFGPAEFAAMKPGAYFVNTARGAIVDEAALLDALKSGRIAGAALDVLCQEPPPADSPLLAFAREQPERLIVTPHLAGCSVESMEKAEVLLAQKLVEVLKDGG